MNHSASLQTALYLGTLLLLSWPLGTFLDALMNGHLARRWRWMRATESRLLAIIGASDDDMPWWRYAAALVVLHGVAALAVYAIQRAQGWLPLNPAAMATVEPTSAFNTAISFVTNTDWQGYSGESTMSHLTQMLALTVQNFVSAATGVAVATAMIRGFVGSKVEGLGNAWIDVLRACLWLLLPISLVYALFLVGQGVVQNFSAPIGAKLIEPVTYTQQATNAQGQGLVDAQGKAVMQSVTTSEQTIPMGPVASQEAIKMLGTNGGGFFNANSAHPFENPTPLSNFVQMVSIFLLPAALVFMFGRMVGDRRQGLVLLATMTLIFVAMLAIAIWSERQANPLLTALGVDGHLGNMEGKETRFGALASAFFATITTAASCGAVNAMHASFMPLGGGVTMWLIQLGEVVFGGVGSGLYGMLVFCILAVFLAGLMIGRTPEYLGKKIGSFEVKMVSIAILVTPMLVLGGTSLALLTDAGRAGILNPGPHGLSEVLYAYSSAANNNGSAFAGLSANTPFYNLTLAVAMWFGRFTVIIPVLAIAGSLAAKPRLAVSAGTMPTDGPLFVGLLIGTVVIVGALTYLPALALGPIVEHLQLLAQPR